MVKFVAGTAVGIGIAAVLSGCGGGGSPTPSPSPSPSPGPGPAPGPPAPPPGPMDCPDDMKRGHCTSCASQGGKVICNQCSGDYEPDSAASKPELSCIFKKTCTPGEKPAKPDNVQGNNGVRWPTMCHTDLSESRFFGIGDWGGMCGWDGHKCEAGKISQDCMWKYDPQQKGYLTPGGPCPMPNRGSGGSGPFIDEIEANAQQRVAARMSERYDQLKADGHAPEFVVNVGDNFYPGGVNVHCGQGDISTTQQQFDVAWKGVYNNLATDMEWWGVLGNHDYGGVCYVKGWDQQIWYTYNQDTWTMPGQYWFRSVQYKNFKMDFYMVDGNWYDTDNTGIGQQPKHDICNRQSNPGKYCEQEYYPAPGGPSSVCAGTGPTSGDDCPSWFEALWDNQYKWLMKEVPSSDADWQVVVTHYPGSYDLGMPGKNLVRWQEWGPQMGLDLIITGHTHFQQLLYGDHGPGQGDWTETAMVITGGGGGVTTEALPMPTGEDDSYGYTEYTVTLHEINVKTYSHGGTQNKQIMRNQTTVKPVNKKSDEEIIKAGLDPRNLLKGGTLTV